MSALRYVSPTINLEELDDAFYRADIEFQGVDHAEASYEARIFLNNPDANEKTEKTATEGYAGSFHIFGHGGCFGDVGHCEVSGPRRPFDPRLEHPLVPTTKVVTATDAVRQALASGNEVIVTVVPVVTGGTDQCDLENVLKFKGLKFVTYV